jgi:hypothetical protein
VDISLRVCETTAGSAQMDEMHHASLLDLLETALLVGDHDRIDAAIARAGAVVDFRGTMAWHHRQRYCVQRARFALMTGDAAAARELAASAIDDAQARRSGRYGDLAAVVAARADAALGDIIDGAALDATLARLDRCAGLEAWMVTAELAAATGVDQWWRDADRRAGALVAASGDHAETLRKWIGVTFTRLGR